ncbi:MAG TPA: hypothetical protein PKW33_12525 [Anaerolineaceae bacterium]|nr:hypothetical protein [Anaerolineaceae bacterium]HPN52408.1 hypothetical protein [Anaerolineaceae bacterium]
MTKISPEMAAKVDQISALAHVLYVSIENGDSNQIHSAQQQLTSAAEEILTGLENLPLSGQDKAVVHLLAGAAVKELPVSIQDPANYPRILHEIRLLKNSLILLK